MSWGKGREGMTPKGKLIVPVLSELRDALSVGEHTEGRFTVDRV